MSPPIRRHTMLDLVQQDVLADRVSWPTEPPGRQSVLADETYRLPNVLLGRSSIRHARRSRVDPAQRSSRSKVMLFDMPPVWLRSISRRLSSCRLGFKTDLFLRVRNRDDSRSTDVVSSPVGSSRESRNGSKAELVACRAWAFGSHARALAIRQRWLH